jgi:hypothetical protein
MTTGCMDAPLCVIVAWALLCDRVTNSCANELSIADEMNIYIMLIWMDICLGIQLAVQNSES